MAIANIKMTLLCPIEQVWNHERKESGRGNSIHMEIKQR